MIQKIITELIKLEKLISYMIDVVIYTYPQLGTLKRSEIKLSI